MSAGVQIRIVGDDDAALRSFAEMFARLDTRGGPSTLADMRRFDAMVGSILRLDAVDDGQVIALAQVSGAYHDPESTTLPAYINVAQSHRGRGLGRALFDRLVQWSNERCDAPTLMTVIPERDVAAIAWWSRRGLEPADRYVMSQLELARINDDVAQVAGVTVCSLADRPDLEDAAYEVYAQAFRQMPGERFEPPPPEDWTIALRDGRRDPGAWCFAVDDADGSVLAVCTTVLKPGEANAHTGFLGVREDARGRGLGRLLKSHQIAWCREQGATVLGTNNHDANQAMRHINAQLGFVEQPAQVLLKGAPLHQRRM